MVRIGLTPAGYSAATIPSASNLPSTTLTAPPSALKLLASVFWKGAGLMSAIGTHMRVVPAGFSTSMRVVTSNVRQLPGDATCANNRSALLNARPADAMHAEVRKSRRFIESPLGPDFRPFVNYSRRRLSATTASRWGWEEIGAQRTRNLQRSSTQTGRYPFVPGWQHN